MSTPLRIAALADEAIERTGEAGLVVGRHQAPGQQQTPGGGVDEQRGAVAQVRLPVAGADLVADQRIAGALVGDAQQGFGQAHQGHALLGRQRELTKQALHHSGTPGCTLGVAQLLGDAMGQLMGGLGLGRRQARLLQQQRQQFLFRPAIGRGDGRAQHQLQQDAFGEFQERLVDRIGQGLDGFVVAFGQTLGDALQIGQGRTAFQGFQIGIDGLLDQPVGRPIDTARRFLEAIAGGFVELYAQGGGSGHAQVLKQEGVEIRRSLAPLEIKVQPSATRKVLPSIRLHRKPGNRT